MLEDTATDAELVQRMLKRGRIANPLKVIPSGEQALVYLKRAGTSVKPGRSRPFLILLDLQLLGMSGLDFVRQLKANARVCDIPVVTLSFNTSAPTLLTGLKRGVAAHLIKPIGNADLVRIAKKLKLRLTYEGALPPAGRNLS